MSGFVVAVFIGLLMGAAVFGTCFALSLGLDVAERERRKRSAA